MYTKKGSRIIIPSGTQQLLMMKTIADLLLALFRSERLDKPPSES